MCVGVGVGFVATKRERIMNGSVWLVMNLLRVGIGVAATSSSFNVHQRLSSGLGLGKVLLSTDYFLG